MKIVAILAELSSFSLRKRPHHEVTKALSLFSFQCFNVLCLKRFIDTR
jgi:hypothetical protein